MVEPDSTGTVAALGSDSPSLLAIVHHLCEGDCHAFGDVLEGCESRGDCSYAVVCPTCRRQFLVEEDDLAELRRWTNQQGTALSCGVRWE
jgi:hypothetical protein